MKRSIPMPKVACAGLLVIVVCAPLAASDVKPRADFARRATWKSPTPAEAREQVARWMEAAQLDPAVRARVEMLWSMDVAAEGDRTGESTLLDRVVASLAAADPRAAELALACSQPRRQIALPDAAWLADDATDPLLRNNLRLVFGRWLVQESLYDEALEQLGGLKTTDVVDPAGLLFYQAVVHHRMLAREPGLEAISRLLENETDVARRYTTVARLMQADLEGLKDESLDHIARRMEDIRRRLDLGRAGPKVRKVEDDVIASLDKLIEEMEKQQQAAAAAAASRSGKGGAQPSMPLPDSRPVEQKGPGDVAKKPVGDTSGWGDLPPRERQEALQQIGKDFPAHYRDVIEQYFRKLAADEGDQPEK